MCRFRVAIISKEKIASKNFNTRDEVDQFILENNARRFRILDKKLGRVIETEKGIIKDNK